MERTYLSTTVREHLVRPNRSLTYPIDVIRGLCFSKYLRSLRIRKLAPKAILMGQLLRYRIGGLG
jgi:hypothetical protein